MLSLSLLAPSSPMSLTRIASVSGLTQWPRFLKLVKRQAIK
ncbi:hypothetical protein HU200_063992 [Digitaria exilis]|uniref:Uncharacterized protein n=1 Tax=Digitaria exilis TaxID=1010633 RepID=A0A835A2P4_9POAL|nr:hypothetical protein HU200_063992 [Digitaria exilis]